VFQRLACDDATAPSGEGGSTGDTAFVAVMAAGVLSGLRSGVIVRAVISALLSLW
jgi:hypothetical protein